MTTHTDKDAQPGLRDEYNEWFQNSGLVEETYGMWWAFQAGYQKLQAAVAERDTALTIVADIADNLISWKKGDGFSEVKIDSDHVEAMVARLRECADKAAIRNEIELARLEKFAAIQCYNKVIDDLAERDAVIDGFRWRPMSEHPPEMQPVIGKSSAGIVGIAYVYKLSSEAPQWNFMSMGMNAMGLWDENAVWMPLPDKQALFAIEKLKGAEVNCKADRDGDCTWKDCPQTRDNEPQKSNRHCPLDKDEDDE